MTNLHQYRKHRWLTPKAKVTHSKISGFGLTAVKRIHKGEIVRVLGGYIVPFVDIKAYADRYGHIAMQINDKFFMAPRSVKELHATGTTNHSCNPNLGLYDSITFVAIKNIGSGDELTIDYAFSETFSEKGNGELFRCNCGAKNCRKIIRVDDWKIKRLQEKYGNYFSPYIKRKFV
jgi:hypothetical protein